MFQVQGKANNIFNHENNVTILDVHINVSRVKKNNNWKNNNNSEYM